MKNIKILALILLAVLLIGFFISHKSAKLEGPIEGASFKDSKEYFKTDLGFTFSPMEKRNSMDVLIGQSPAGQGNSIISMVGNYKSDQLKSLNFVYYLDEEIDFSNQDYILNSIYLGLMLDQIPDFNDARIWIHDNIQDIINEEPIVVKESKDFGNRRVDIDVSHDGYRKLDLTISGIGD